MKIIFRQRRRYDRNSQPVKHKQPPRIESPSTNQQNQTRNGQRQCRDQNWPSAVDAGDLIHIGIAANDHFPRIDVSEVMLEKLRYYFGVAAVRGDVSDQFIASAQSTRMILLKDE